MLEAAAQEAQQTVDSAGDLFKGLQAEWQVLAPLPPCLWRPRSHRRLQLHPCLLCFNLMSCLPRHLPRRDLIARFVRHL